jgi:hypothetical protein
MHRRQAAGLGASSTRFLGERECLRDEIIAVSIKILSRPSTEIEDFRRSRSRPFEPSGAAFPSARIDAADASRGRTVDMLLWCGDRDCGYGKPRLCRAHGLIYINESSTEPVACTAMNRDTLWLALATTWFAFLAIGFLLILFC